MSEYYEKACARLDDECKNGKFDKYGNVMKSAVRDAPICKSARLTTELFEAESQEARKNVKVDFGK